MFTHRVGKNQSKCDTCGKSFTRHITFSVDFQWINNAYGTQNEWMDKMYGGDEWCDEIFLRLIAIYFNRKFIVFPVFPDLKKNARDRNIIDPHADCNCGEKADESATPFTLLYYEETHFVSSHYQSIRKKPGATDSDNKSPPPVQRQKSLIDPIITSEIESSNNFESNEPEKNNESILSFHESYLGSVTNTDPVKPTQTSTNVNKKAKNENSTKNKRKNTTTTTTKPIKRKQNKKTNTKTKKPKFCDMDSTNDSIFLPDVQSTKIHDYSVLNTSPGHKNYFDNTDLESSQSVIGQKNHKCISCGKLFSQAGSLKKHINSVHNGQKDHKCDSCEKAFSTAQTLTKHIESVHNDQKDHTNLESDSEQGEMVYAAEKILKKS